MEEQNGNMPGVSGLPQSVTRPFIDFTMGRYIQYETMRDQGLRIQALSTISQLVQDLQELDAVYRKVLTQELLEREWRVHRHLDYIPASLMNKVIVPLLNQWRHDEPESPLPYRWLGIQEWNTDHLEQARRLDPDEITSRVVLVEQLIEQIQFSVQSLANFAPGCLQAAVTWAEQARIIAAEISEFSLKHHLLEEVAKAFRTVDEWNTMWSAGTLPRTIFYGDGGPELC